jgi:serine protease Do
VKHFSRLGTLTIIAGGVMSLPLAYAAGLDFHPASDSAHLLLSNGSQGYLGVGLRDVDSERAAALKLKDPHGAEITSIDKDAPAFKSGLRIHDVVIQMNGQHVEGIEQFRRMLHEIPPGRTITLAAYREGQQQNFSVQLADRTQLAAKVIDDLETDPPSAVNAEEPPPTIVLPSGSHSSGFFGNLTRNRYYVGVDIQPLPTGLADYFGARSGVLVGNVFSNSPASVAGLKAADVIQKVNGQPIVTLSDWEKAIHANRGKRVQVTIIRERRELTLSMIAGVTKGTSELDFPMKKPPVSQSPATQTTAELCGGSAPAFRTGAVDLASFGETSR